MRSRTPDPADKPAEVSHVRWAEPEAARFEVLAEAPVSAAPGQQPNPGGGKRKRGKLAKKAAIANAALPEEKQEFAPWWKNRKAKKQQNQGPAKKAKGKGKGKGRKGKA